MGGCLAQQPVQTQGHGVGRPAPPPPSVFPPPPPPVPRRSQPLISLTLIQQPPSFTMTPASTGTRTGGLLWGLVQEMGCGGVVVVRVGLCSIHMVSLEVLITRQQIQTGDTPPPPLKPLTHCGPAPTSRPHTGCLVLWTFISTDTLHSALSTAFV